MIFYAYLKSFYQVVKQKFLNYHYWYPIALKRFKAAYGITIVTRLAEIQIVVFNLKREATGKVWMPQKRILLEHKNALRIKGQKAICA